MFVPNLMETVPMVMQNMKNVFRQSSEKQPKKPQIAISRVMISLPSLFLNIFLNGKIQASKWTGNTFLLKSGI